MTIILTVLCVVLASLLGLSVYFNIKHGRIIIDMEDAIEESLRVFDESYDGISKVAEIPIMLDTPEVRQVLAHINSARNAVFYVSNVMAAPIEGVEDEEE